MTDERYEPDPRRAAYYGSMKYTEDDLDGVRAKATVLAGLVMLVVGFAGGFFIGCNDCGTHMPALPPCGNVRCCCDKCSCKVCTCGLPNNSPMPKVLP